MFTLKFQQHDSANHEVFSCERYSVSIEFFTKDDETVTTVCVVRMFRTLKDEDPYYETIGREECYGIAYVMNEQGKTIDTLR